MNCEEFKKHLPDLVDGGLSEPLSRQLMAHKESCPSCGNLYADHCGIVRVFANSAVSIPPHLHERILGRLTLGPSETPSDPSGPSSPTSSSTSSSVFGVKAMLKLAGILSIGFGILAVPAIFRTSGPQPISRAVNTQAAQSATSAIAIPIKPRPEPESATSSDGTSIRVAAADSSPADKETARFLCSGRNDENQIMAAFTLLGAKPGTVELSKGTYVCSGMLSLPAGLTILGHGANKTLLTFEGGHPISLQISQPGVTLKDFSISGKGSILIRSGNTKLQGVTLRNISGSQASGQISPVAALDVVAVEKQLNDVVIENCTISKSDLAGIAVRSLKSPSAMKGITVTDCTTEECGIATHRPGYLVSQAQDVTFRNCTDVRSHIGWSIAEQSSRINIIDSSAKNNAKWALWVRNAHHLSVTGFHQIDQQGTEGLQSMNGIADKVGSVSSPVSDSIFEVFAHGGPQSRLINEAGLRNQFSLHPEAPK